MSKLTLIFSAFIGILNARAGTTGSADAETARLQDEVSAARNELDALVLQRGVKLDDPRVKQKALLVDEKIKALEKQSEAAHKVTTPPSYPNRTPDQPNGERVEASDGKETVMGTLPGPVTVPAASATSAPPAPAEPPTVLSGENIQSEITYPKKTKAGKTERTEPPARTKRESSMEPLPAPDAAGLSEIQYPKRKP